MDEYSDWQFIKSGVPLDCFEAIQLKNDLHLAYLTEKSTLGQFMALSRTLFPFLIYNVEHSLLIRKQTLSSLK